MEEPDTPVRLIIGVYGSPAAAVRSVAAARYWPPKSEAKLVAVDDPLIPDYFGQIISPLANIIEEDKQQELIWATKKGKESAELLAHSQDSKSLTCCEKVIQNKNLRRQQKNGVRIVFL